MRWLALVALVGCVGSEEEPSSDYVLWASSAAEVRRVGDPLLVRFEVRRADGSTELCSGDDRTWCNVDLSHWPPLLRSPSGTVVPAAPLDAVGTLSTQWVVPIEEYGTWTVIGAVDLDLPLEAELELEIGPWGATDIGAVDVEGRTWALHTWHSRPIDLGSLGESLPPVFVDIPRADAATADLRVIAEVEGTHCVVLQAEARWEGSELVYETTRLAVDHPDYGELAAEDVRLALAWADAVDRADGRLDARVDTYGVDAIFEGGAAGSGETCSTIASFGATCIACADGGTDCVDVHLYEMDFVEDTALAFASDLPLCGVDALNGQIPSFSCDATIPTITCDGIGCSTAGRAFGPLVVFLAPWLIRRRRTG